MKKRYQEIEAGRAKFAYDRAVEHKNISCYDKYRNHVKSFPSMIKTNGLGAALVFLYSKGDKEQGVYQYVFEDVFSWIKEDDKYKLYGFEDEDIANKTKFSGSLVSLNSDNYRALTIEILSYLSWLKRFTEGYYLNNLKLKDKQENENV